MSAHTPGRWAAEFPDEISVRSEDGTRIAILGNLRGRMGMQGRIPTSEVEANARMVAAAPDLLAELRHAHTIIRNALKIMTTEQQWKWGELNEIASDIPGEGVTRTHEREAVIKRAEGRS